MYMEKKDIMPTRQNTTLELEYKNEENELMVNGLRIGEPGRLFKARYLHATRECQRRRHILYELHQVSQTGNR